MTLLRGLCINNQTPLVRFLVPPEELKRRFPRPEGPIPIELLVPGQDYVPTSGGVVQVVLPLVEQLLAQGEIERAYWLSLLPQGPERYLYDGIEMIGVLLEPDDLRAYTLAKEKLWNLIHGLPTKPFVAEDFVAFARYNWECTRRMFELAGKVDLSYVHDFQQLMTGSMIGLAAPAVMRWHIPLAMAKTPPAVRRYLIRGLEGFDAVIVSCRRDLEALLHHGFSGPARQIYPTIDPAQFPPVPPEQAAALRARFGIPAEAPLLLNVGRMDPMKGQDVLLEAMARMGGREPLPHLLLVGNGSFTGATSGGLGAGKSAQWRGHLEGLVRERALADRVHFAGHLDHAGLCAAYAASDLFVLPSPAEGFGLVVGEAWLYGRPVVVSQGAGVSELVNEGVNGRTFPSGDVPALAQALEEILAAPDRGRAMGARGRDSVSVCFPDRTVPEILRVLRRARETYR